MSVADEYQNTKVVGTDVLPVQRMDAPSNCEFRVESLFHGLSFENDSIDLLHSRFGIPDSH